MDEYWTSDYEDEGEDLASIIADANPGELIDLLEHFAAEGQGEVAQVIAQVLADEHGLDLLPEDEPEPVEYNDDDELFEALQEALEAEQQQRGKNMTGPELERWAAKTLDEGLSPQAERYIDASNERGRYLDMSNTEDRRNYMASASGPPPEIYDSRDSDTEPTPAGAEGGE